MIDRDRMLADARHLRRAARLLAELDATLIQALMRQADHLQNEACGFTEPAAPYDRPPGKHEEEQQPFLE
jgi:hypothetical protein